MIEIFDAVSGYGKKTVLERFSLTAKKGEVVSLIGPNGSGKSTLLKTVAGVIPLSGGDILIDGISVSRLSGRARALKVAYLPQESTVPDMSVYEAVLQGRYPHVGVFGTYGKKERAAAEHTMEEMGLLNISDKKMSELSGGMRRKVSIASVLVGESDYILLDEPCAYLDIGAQLELMNFLKDIAKTLNKGILLVMHDLALAFNFSDRLAVINGGRLVALDTPYGVCSSGCVESVFGVKVIYSNGEYFVSHKGD